MSLFSRIFNRTPTIPLPFVTRKGGIDLGNNPVQDAILNEFNKMGKEINMQRCSKVAEFISSLNLNNNDVSGSLQRICIILQTIDFDDECGPMSLHIKNETFYWFGILLKKYKESKDVETTQLKKKLSLSLNIILERFRMYDLLREKGLSLDELRSEFFERSGGETTANENIYDLIMYKKQQNAESATEKEKIEDVLFRNFGGKKSNNRSFNKRSFNKRSFNKRSYKNRSCKK
jgi:hypothetical protein